jgi:hypothetical protein
MLDSLGRDFDGYVVTADNLGNTVEANTNAVLGFPWRRTVSWRLFTSAG